MTTDDETYLGDGLYASWTGEQIRLRAPRIDGDHVVFLDVGAMFALNQFLHNIRVMRGDTNDETQ
jgi:hypothetical protein